MARPALTTAGPLTAERRRFPGVRSFEEGDQTRFRGRKSATAELLLRVLSVRLLLQFAPSGVGKTSLLNAGLFPELRPHHYFPFIVRLNQPDESLVQAVRRSLSDAAREFGLSDPVIPERAESLWDLLAGTQLWSDDLLLLTPVLVFDQFEEIFTLRDSAFRSTFAVEVGALAGGAARPRANTDLEADVDSPNVTQPLAAKIIISLREEYLGKLEEFSAAIPDLFRERLRLPPLTASEAQEAIVEPARLQGEAWASPAFEFEPACLEALIDFIDGVSDSVKLIEPLTLQLVCQQAETIAMARKPAEGGGPPLRLDDFGGIDGLKDLVREYYQKELHKLPSAATRKRAQRMFEDGLLDPAGKRLMLEQGEIEREYGLQTSTLDALVGSSLLRREPRNESVFYEISHDRLTETIAKNRSPRLPNWVKPTIAAGVLFILFLGGFLLMKNREEREADRAQSQTESSLEHLLSEHLVSRLREAGLSDALKQVLKESQADASSADYVKGLAKVLRLRHEGDIQHDQGTVREAREKFEQALNEIDNLPPSAAEGHDALVLAERARTLKRLGSLSLDTGELAQAEKDYAASLDLWNSVLALSTRPQDLLDAAETRIESGTLHQRMGDIDRGESDIVEGGLLATKVWRTAYGEAQRGHFDTNFEAGRALQIFSDAALTLANDLYSDNPMAKNAVGLARESVRLRPLSFQAVQQYGTAIVSQGRSAPDNMSPALWALLKDARKQFDDLIKVDPGNRRMQREHAALQVAISELVGTCAESAICRKKLPKGAVDEAAISTDESVGNFRRLAGWDPENRSLSMDIAWGLETKAKLLGASGKPDQALPLLEEAIAITRTAEGNVPTIELRLQVAGYFQDKAHQQEKAGRPSEAIVSLDAALAEIEGMQQSVTGALVRSNILSAKMSLLESAGRKDEARHLQEAEPEQSKPVELPWDARQERAKQLALKGDQLQAGVSPNNEANAVEQYRQTLEARESAIAENPFDIDLWLKLATSQMKVANHAQLADAAASGAASAASASNMAVSEQALRDANIAISMAAALSPDELAIESVQLRYLIRRALALFLHNHDRTQEALELMTQAAEDAKSVASPRPTPRSLFDLADVNSALAMLRHRSRTSGWQEPMRVALSYADQLAKLQPKNPERQIWIGVNRSSLATLLAEDSPLEATAERKLALKACREGLRLAKALPDQREAAEDCLKDLAALGYE